MKHLMFGIAWAVTAICSAPAWAQPSLSHSVPGAVQPGNTLELTLHGDKLDGPLQIWTSFPAKVEILPGPEGATDQKSRTCKLTLESGVGLGIGGLLVGSPAGVSDVLLLPVDDLTSVPDSGSNHAPEQAQPITLPIAVDGVADGSNSDYYKFTGKKGERLSVEVIAARLGWAFDAVIRLLRSDGTELLLTDDDASSGADARTSLLLPEDGEYLLEIRDNQFRGGGRYRLRVGDFPLVTVPFPLGGRLGSTSQFQFAGTASEDAAPLLMRIPDQVATGRMQVSAKYPAGKSAAAATLAATQLPEVVEYEPNESQAAATAVTIPAAVNGHFASSADRDCYTFVALKDQSLSFTAVSRSLGSPSLVFMRLFDASGKQLAETQVNNSDEWTLTHKFPADGLYCLQVEDLLHRGGPEHAYRVEIQPSSGFSLAVKNDKDTRLLFNAPVNDGALAVTIQCNRQGYNGPIELALHDAAPGYQLLNATIPEGAKEHRLILAVPEGAQPGEVHAIRLAGRATVDGRPQVAVVETQATLRAKRPQQTFPPAWLDGLVAIALADAAEPFYAAKFESPTAPFQRDSGQAVLTFTLERKQPEFKEGLTVLVQNLPSGFSSAVKAEQDKYTITVTGPKDAPDGTHMIKIVSYGEFQGKGRLVVQDVPLEIKTAEVTTQN